MRWRPRLKQADRLIAGSVIGSLLVVWVLLVGFDAFTNFARQLGSLGEHGYTLAQAAWYIVLTIPRRAYEMFGHAALIGSLLGLGALAGQSELIALRAAGMSQARIAISALLAVAALLVLVLVLGETLAPIGQQRAQALQLSLQSRSLGMTTRSGLWARDGERIVNAKDSLVRMQDGHEVVELRDVRVFSFDAAGALTALAWAQSAIHEGGRWMLRKVRTTRFDASGAHSSREAQRPWDSRLDPRLLKLSVVHPEYLSLHDLGRNIRYLRGNGQNPQAYLEAWWARVFYPLDILVLVLAAVPFAFGALRSGGLGKRIFIGIILAVSWYFVQLALVSLGTVYGLPPWLANLLPPLLLALALAGYYARRRA
ncbi:MAG TPA: LPS export ABC transporter permease LptG [Rhodanobacteraceae bacterium]|nr:LPS export ABC transporter permease LptG [Rhodanobacteraceae bacterium]